jgi:hypothetical protein
MRALPLRGLWLAGLLAQAIAWKSAGAAVVDAIEYYNAPRDHYFVTSLADEISALDAGVFAGWQRTGLSFKVYDAGSIAFGADAVCRFYGLPSAGLDSHFYTASSLECSEVQQNFAGAWMLESNNVFEVLLPDLTTGQCPVGSIPIYRAWNARFDSNHRYTTDPAVQLSMIAKGYIAEGYGPPSMPVAMCSPNASAPAGAPICSPTASDTTPFIGTSITLAAHCTGNPTSYAWTGCSSSGNQCTATSSVSGAQTYSVVASNAFGASTSAGASVTWRNMPSPPVCSLFVTANSDQPVVGTQVLLIAACNRTPTTYNWTGCASSGSECVTSSPVAGVQAYSVVASNAGGAGSPAAASVSWQSSPSASPGLCTQFPSFLYTDIGWADAAVPSRDFTGDPGFAWNGAWTVRISVPPGATSSGGGRLSVFEFDGPPVTRDMTLSRVPCDFRPVDPTGNNGPLLRVNAVDPSSGFALGAPSGGVPGLMPGTDYFLNVRNWQIETGYISCDPAIGRCNAEVYITMPP